MAPTYAAILLVVLLVILLFALVVLMRKRKTPTDYYNMFLIGFMWTAIGIPLEMFPFSAIGIILMLIGLIHRNDWKQHKHKTWKELDKKEKTLSIALTIMLAALVVVGFAVSVVIKR